MRRDLPTDRLAVIRVRSPHAIHSLALAASLALISACSAPRATPYVAPPPAPTTSPWSLTATIKYQSKVTLGGTFDIEITVANTGRAASPATGMTVDGLDDHADLAECSPDCKLEGFLGANFATFAAVPPGGTAIYTLTFQTTKLGKITPFVCVYDDRAGRGVQVDCGEASVVIGG